MRHREVPPPTSERQAIHIHHLPLLAGISGWGWVGGGSAGSVLANRLSHDSSNRVLLLEAGGVEDSVTDVPMMASVSHHTNIDWSFVSEPQKGCSFALRDQKIFLLDKLARGEENGEIGIENSAGATDENFKPLVEFYLQA
ncbi:hypothetical protein HPB51_003449 [Rhipicephalus microplus]|uniref:Glucose-methanol-choline oxidoreductase N-terminal domain-containing protein n=1 Tax=Rhipicephalus microplus TaxID=6941 RepID=A0A9J6EY29_RHIMP|nr:hypothetical protein HPB51_003449 [Rhipicephalus microplus]